MSSHVISAFEQANLSYFEPCSQLDLTLTSPVLRSAVHLIIRPPDRENLLSNASLVEGKRQLGTETSGQNATAEDASRGWRRPSHCLSPRSQGSPSIRKSLSGTMRELWGMNTLQLKAHWLLELSRKTEEYQINSDSSIIIKTISYHECILTDGGCINRTPTRSGTKCQSEGQRHERHQVHLSLKALRGHERRSTLRLTATRACAP